MDRLLDGVRAGPFHLRQPEVARMVVEALQYHEREFAHYQLHNYVVMQKSRARVDHSADAGSQGHAIA